MPLTAPSPGPKAATNNSGRSAHTASSAIRASGIKSAINRTTGEEGTQDVEATDRGNTKTYSGRTTSTESTERTASGTVNRFEKALSDPSSYASSASGFGAGASGSGAAGAAIAGGAGGSGASAAWGGAGAQAPTKQASYGGGGGASGGGGCSGGSCGGGSQTQQSQNSPSQQSQSNGGQSISESSSLRGLNEEMKAGNDRAFLIKEGSSGCPPCRQWDDMDKGQLEAKYEYKKVDSGSEIAQELRKLTGNEGGIPAFYRVSRGDDGKLTVEHLQNGLGSVSELTKKMDDAEKSNKHYKASEIERPQENKPEGNNSPEAPQAQRPDTPRQESPEPTRPDTPSQENQNELELRPVNARLEIQPEALAQETQASDTKQTMICSGSSCNLHEIDFGAKDINQEIDRFSKAVSESGSRLEIIPDSNFGSPLPDLGQANNSGPSKILPADQSMVDRLHGLSSDDNISREDKVAGFKSEVENYEKRHKPLTISEE